MYVGQLTNIKETTFTHKGVSVPFPPSSVETGLGTWLWRYAYDSELDVNFELEFGCFVGALSVDISKKSVTRLEVLVDGAVYGS